MSSEVLLCAINARYSHASFGLRYLLANLPPELRARSEIREFTISQSARDIAEKILAEKPRVVGLGSYIWNTDRLLEVLSILRAVAPEVIVFLGGPEISYETETQPHFRLCDGVIAGEADLEFPKWCEVALNEGRPGLLARAGKLPFKHVCETPEITQIQLPYGEFTDEDVKNRVVYVEASRGCPYKCEYCLSSLDKSVRAFELERFLGEMKTLITRGVRQFKFVDRTFNLSPTTSQRILSFFYEELSAHPEGLFLHFEMVPDRLPESLRELISKFPKGSLQFEVGIQTWNPEIAKLVSRRQDYTKIRENFAYLAAHTGVHTHADLIAGLPGEDLTSFAHGFNEVLGLGADEIQVGVLKRLKGTPIVRHDDEWGMVYQNFAPFQILRTKVMSFDDLARVARFSQYWDSVGNSGNFKQTVTAWREWTKTGSFFDSFMGLSDWLYAKRGQAHSLSLPTLVEDVFHYLKDRFPEQEEALRSLLTQDYAFGATRRDVPRFLRGSNEVSPDAEKASRSKHPPAAGSRALPERQRRHQEVST